MDLFWSKTKNWALHNFNNSLIWNHYMVQWAIKNSISIHSSLSYRQIGEKVLIFLVIPFDFSIMISSASHEWIKMLKYADILSSCFAHQECRQKDVERLLKSHGRQGLRPPGDLGNIQCERKHVTHEQLEIDFGCQWSPTRVSSSSK